MLEVVAGGSQPQEQPETQYTILTPDLPISETVYVLFSPFLSGVYVCSMHVRIHEWSYLCVGAYACVHKHTWRLKVDIRLLSASPPYVLRQGQLK